MDADGGECAGMNRDERSYQSRRKLREQDEGRSGGIGRDGARVTHNLPVVGSSPTRPTFESGL